MSDERSVRCDVRGPVATVTLDRPEGRNAMTASLVQQAYEVLTELGGRDEVRIVELTGSGDRFFCPGADLHNRGDHATRVEVRHLRVPVLLHEMPQLTIAAINGSCAGAGLGWACGCDLRVATASARFNTAFLDCILNERYGLVDYQTMMWGLAESSEPREGITAFMEKRAPSCIPAGLADGAGRR